MADVSIRGLSKTYGDQSVVSDVSLDIASGEMVAFLGPSGCGKTTTLRMIAGFVPPTSGQILIDGDDVANAPAHRRGISMVFQRFALFPHMTAARNVAFGLEMRRRPWAEIQTRVDAALDLVRMADLAERYPRQLSGGQQQRVAIARALVVQPKLVLLDEPLSSLDANLRLEVREELRALQQRLGLTAVIVTHDQEEALAMADRIAIMHRGAIQQVAAPDTLYDRPANAFVARFLGGLNLFEGALRPGGAFITAAGTALKVRPGATEGRRLGVRPERIRLSGAPSGEIAVSATVVSVTYLGPQLEVALRTSEGETLAARVVNTSTHPRPRAGEAIFACFDASDCLLFTE